jgi:hypothetical protein
MDEARFEFLQKTHLSTQLGIVLDLVKLKDRCKNSRSFVPAYRVMTGHVNRIIEYVRSTHPREHLQGCCLMIKLLDEETVAMEFARSPGLLQRLIALGLHATISVQTRVGILLQKFARYEESSAILIYHAAILPALIEFLLPNAYPHMQIYSCAILANLSFHPHMTHTIVEQPGLVKSLLEAVGGPSQTRAFACDALYNLCHSSFALATHRAALFARMAPLLTERDPRVSLCAALCIVNTLERNSLVPEECTEAFSTKSVSAIVGALNAALNDHDYLGNSWRPLGCMFAVNNLSFIHKCRQMLEQREVMQLLLLAMRQFLQLQQPSQPQMQRDRQQQHIGQRENSDGDNSTTTATSTSAFATSTTDFSPDSAPPHSPSPSTSTSTSTITYTSASSDGTNSAEVALFAAETMFNILTSLPRPMWSEMIGESETTVFHLISRVRDKLLDQTVSGTSESPLGTALQVFRLYVYAPLHFISSQ